MRDVVRAVVKPVVRRAVRAEYAFRMTFSPGSIPAGLITSIAGVRQDYLTAEDEANEILTDFPANIPVITYKGLKPESGNSLSSQYVSKVQKINERISTRGTTLTVSFTATSNSADIVGTVQVFGPIYANSSGLMFNDGTNTASYTASWGAGTTMIVVAEIANDGTMRIGGGING